MLEIKSLLEALSDNEEMEQYQDDNDDYDFGKVLEFCSESTLRQHKIRYSDGTIKEISFDE